MTSQNWPQDPVTTPGTGAYTTDTGADQSTTSTAKHEAAAVGQEGMGAAKNVAATAGSEAKNVAHEAGTQAKNLVGQLGSDLKSQAGAGQTKVTEGIRSISDQLQSMAQQADDGGPAKQLVQQAAQRTGDVAGWLEGRDPADLLQEVKSFARQRPGTFLLVAAGAGLLAGRLTRGLTGGAAAGSTSASPASGNGSPSYAGSAYSTGAVPGGTYTPAHAAPATTPLATDPTLDYPTIAPGTPPVSTQGDGTEFRP